MHPVAPAPAEPPTTPPTAGALLRALAQALDAQDWDALSALLHPDLRVHYPYDGERFDRDGFVALNRDYPGAWRVTVEDLVDAGDRAVLRARVTDGAETHHLASFATAEGGRLMVLEEIWAEQVDGPPLDRRPDLG